jgi:hypothetical protein
MKCLAIIDQVCPLKHAFTTQCHNKDTKTCPKCKAEIEAAERKRQRDYKLEQERLVKQREYAAKLAELDDEMAHEKRLLRNMSEDKDRQSVLAQKRQDLQNLRDQKLNPQKEGDSPQSNLHHPKPATAVNSNSASQAVTRDHPAPPTSSSIAPNIPDSDDNASVRSDSSDGGSPTPSGNGTPRDEHQLPALNRSEAKDDWDWQKNFEGASNQALDDLIDMIGRSYPLKSDCEVRNEYT